MSSVEGEEIVFKRRPVKVPSREKELCSAGAIPRLRIGAVGMAHMNTLLFHRHSLFRYSQPIIREKKRLADKI